MRIVQAAQLIDPIRRLCLCACCNLPSDAVSALTTARDKEAAGSAARNVLDPGRMEASARFEGDFRDMAFLEALLPDSALRRRIAIPDRIRLRGTAGSGWRRRRSLR